MTDARAVAGPSSAPSTSSYIKPRKPKSKWEDDEDDEVEVPTPKKKKVKKQVKTFSTSLHASTPGLDSPSSYNGGEGSAGPSSRRGTPDLSRALDQQAETSSSTTMRGPTSSERNGGSSTSSGTRRRHSSGIGGSSTSGRHPALQGCRSVYKYERLNHIEEGSYGVVSRARDRETGDIVALKKLKMDQEKNGFPITSLREIRTLMMVGNHENIVRVREIVVGDTLTQIFIVMDFIEHDLKTLLATMRTPFLASEVKTLLQQLLSAIALCHDNWILHRDLKTSNLLMNNRGQIKVADFGLARTYGEPLGDMTQLVVTLWYRAPELLLGETEYSTAVDMWSIGCIFAELIQKEPLFPGKGEIDQLNRIFKLLGRPSEDIWPGFDTLPSAKSINVSSIQPYSNLRAKFRYTTDLGVDLMSKLLTYDPRRRISAEEALKHPWFQESPLPKHPDMFQSFPSTAAGDRKRVYASPAAPERQADKYELIL